MGNQQVLLQMLMPIVRPDGVTPSNPSQKLPLEDQSFEQMLTGLQKTETAAPLAPSSLALTGQESEASPKQMMKQLGGMDRIENPVLREMLAQSQRQGSDGSQD
ncbi:MAG: hypothetical protein JKX85_04190 [Phycisphaeraceae bacterium]|nr:hypothetical protein [Phycisphaeraceae bacterium]